MSKKEIFYLLKFGEKQFLSSVNSIDGPTGLPRQVWLTDNVFEAKRFKNRDEALNEQEKIGGRIVMLDNTLHNDVDQGRGYY